MSSHNRESWLHRLFRRASRPSADSTDAAPPAQPTEISIVPAAITLPRADGLRSIENWRDLVQQGRRVVLSWEGGPRRATVSAEGEVRLTFEETVWIWLDRELPALDRPTVGQAMHVLAAGNNAMHMIPCQLVDEGRGSSLQVTVSGRLSRVQRRDDVRARVKLAPVSAVRLGPSGKPVGLVGLDVIDLSAGGIRMRASEPLASGDRRRLILRIDNGQPLTPVVDVLIGGVFIQGRFDPMPERERRRIVQYVYRQELQGRQRPQAAAPAD